VTAPLVLRGASLIDGTGAPPVRGRAVVVEHGRIADVVDESRAPAGPTLRLDGLTLLPGLFNCHVHLSFGGEPDPGAVMRADARGSSRDRASSAPVAASA